MIFLFLTGFVAGGAIGWFFWWSSRREMNQLIEEKLLLAQEKQIAFDFMHNMVEAIGEGVTREELFQRVVHAAILSTGALSSCIFEQKGEMLQGVAVEGLFPPHRPLPESSRIKITTRAKFLEQILKSETFKVGEGLVGMVSQLGKGLLIRDALNDPRVIRHSDPSLEIRSLIIVPIQFRDKKIAVLALVNPSNGGSFGETDLSLCESLAEQAGLAIHNLDLMSLQIEKNKMDADLGLAHEIQSMLLPREFPDNPLLDISTVYKPAQKVGGDLYDIFKLDTDRIGMAIADVSGKGIAASLIMAICQTNLRHLARRIESPSEVLIELNKVMVREMRQDMFVTIIYAVIDAGKHEITISRGGHELPIIVKKPEHSEKYRSELVQSEGMALGMVPDEIFSAVVQNHTLAFNKGDVFTLYTDGVTEAVNSDGTEFSNGRLADVIRTLRNRASKDLNKGVLDRVALFSGSEQLSDDLTLVTVKCLN